MCKVAFLMLSLIGFITKTGLGYVQQNKNVLVIGLKKMGTNVPRDYLIEADAILQDNENIIWKPYQLWDQEKRFGQDGDYLKENNISYIIDGNISYTPSSRENFRENIINISLRDSVQEAIKEYSYSIRFRELKDMAEKLKEKVNDIFYYIENNRSRRKVFIVKFILNEDSEASEKQKVEVRVPYEVAAELRDLKDEQLKSAFNFEFTMKELDELIRENDKTNILLGAFQRPNSTQTEDTDTYYEVEVEILFYQTKEKNITINIPLPKNTDYAKRIAGILVDSLREMVPEPEFEK